MERKKRVAIWLLYMPANITRDYWYYFVITHGDAIFECPFIIMYIELIEHSFSYSTGEKKDCLGVYLWGNFNLPFNIFS